MTETYYCVRKDGKSWTKDAVEASWWERRGFTTQLARLHGDLDLFKDGKPMGTLFKNKIAAAVYVDRLN